MGLLDWLKPTPPVAAGLLPYIDKSAATIDPLIKQISGYEHSLAPAVEHALAYCAEIAQRIPGPFEVSRAAFAGDPMVHALFGSADEIDTMLATSQCVRDHLSPLTMATGRCCALLGMRCHEKQGFGVRLDGDIVRTDVAQTTLYFSDHTLTEPSPDAASARTRLRDLLFEGIVKGIAAHVGDVRAEHALLDQEKAFTHARLRAGLQPEAHTRRLASLHAQLSASTDALQPEKLLLTLVEALAAPEPFLSLDPIDLAIDRAGVIVNNKSSGDLLHFAQLTGRDLRRWVVVLALIDRADAHRALDRFESARHYIVI
jgi:hypothetical protein